MRFKEYIKEGVGKRSHERKAALRKNPPTDETHTWIGKTSKEGWKHADAAKNNIFKHRDKNPVVFKREGYKGYWLAIPKEVK